MLNDLTPEQKQLETFMSDLSEKCYSAGWLENLEYKLWNAVKNGELKLGHSIISQDDIEKLKDLSLKCDCWIYFDDDTEETAIDIFSWTNKFETAVINDPSILYY